MSFNEQKPGNVSVYQQMTLIVRDKPGDPFGSEFDRRVDWEVHFAGKHEDWQLLRAALHRLTDCQSCRRWPEEDAE